MKDLHCNENNDSELRADGAVQLPPTPARIFRVVAGLAQWTPKERDWLKAHPRFYLAFQDQLQATLEDVHRELSLLGDSDEEELASSGAMAHRQYAI